MGTSSSARLWNYQRFGNSSRAYSTLSVSTGLLGLQLIFLGDFPITSTDVLMQMSTRVRVFTKALMLTITLWKFASKYLLGYHLSIKQAPRLLACGLPYSAVKPAKIQDGATEDLFIAPLIGSYRYPNNHVTFAYLPSHWVIFLFYVTEEHN